MFPGRESPPFARADDDGQRQTFTSVASVYRLVEFAGAKRVLFLVDRKNLGTQTLNEFRQYISPHTNRAFTDEYNVQHLRSNTIDPASRVVITTVQRLYSIPKGEEHYEEEAEEHSMFETDAHLVRETLPVVYNPRISIEAFDFIIVGECHRSIYNLWRQVLEYFDAPSSSASPLRPPGRPPATGDQLRAPQQPSPPDEQVRPDHSPAGESPEALPGVTAASDRRPG